MKIKCFLFGHYWHEIGMERLEPPKDVPPDVVINQKVKYHFICLNCPKTSMTREINFIK